MEKHWLFIIGLSIVLILTIIGILGISQTTGAFISKGCWELEKPIEQESELALRMQGCIIERDLQRVCCPFDACPNIEEISCP